MIIGFGNNVVSSLAADITASQTTIQVMPGAGAMFANLLTSDYANSSNPLKTYAKITLTDAKETVFEVCHLTTVNNDMLTVIRGQEGTTAKGWSLNDVIANFATRGSENQFVQIEELQSGHYVAGVAGGTENNLTLELPATYFVNGGADWTLRTPLVVIPALNNTGASTLQLTMGGRVLGIFPLYKGNKSELSASDIIKDVPVLCVLDNTKTYFSVLNPLEIYLGSRYLQKDQNLSDVPDKAKGRSSLEVYSKTESDENYMAKSQCGADIPNKPLFLQNVGLTETVEQARNAVPSTRKVNGKALTTDITLTSGDIGALPVTGGKLNGPLGIGTDNALGGNSIVFGDNDTGFKWHSDGVLGIYANNALVGYIDNSGLHMSVDVLSNGAIRAGNAKKLSLTSNNNSTMTATFNLWGDANRPTVIELDDDQGWHLYSQRNPDGSIVFTVNGDITANTLRAGEAIYQNNGDIFGSAWGGWLSNWVNNNFVRAVRLGPQAISGGLWRDYQLGGGNVVTGFHTDGSWEMEGDDDKVYYRPVQFLVGGTWITASSV
ncbi:phage tail protein [Salmonella enterica]|uniref:Phage tail protein n=4 Tax=Salmonella enterica TaxID=28901 RepID=A0A742DIZ5_SALMU|nr:phage tail protein [Salmonella enterica]ECX3436764.1 phage tail protein [Salmonella enterica subsp. enterica serovar Rubislaw]EDC1983901.1 phage tail protein [Salmonella enterica subsp. enterica serovar Muenchen]EAM1262578.1 phage tail protein [Salmonella enterica]EAR2435420.1 phage tail protein [Salmonella enterica]EAS1800920.1 phage tail protein [Salmonella enterica]